MADVTILVEPIESDVTIEVSEVKNGADGVGLPTGGATGQVLTKVSATDYDTEWDNIDEEDIKTDVAQPTITAGAYTFDVSVSRVFLLTLTEDTVFTLPTLANGTGLTFTAIVSGDFSLTVTDATLTPTSNTYDGTIANRLIFDCYRTSAGVQTNILTLENLA